VPVHGLFTQFNFTEIILDDRLVVPRAHVQGPKRNQICIGLIWLNERAEIAGLFWAFVIDAYRTARMAKLKTICRFADYQQHRRH